MVTVKLFMDGNCQAVRLPKRWRMNGEEVYAQKIGNAIMLIPKDKAWETFLEGIDEFTEDYFTALDQREEIESQREML